MRPSQESDIRGTGAFLSLTPTDRVDEESVIVVERRNSKETEGIILALGKRWQSQSLSGGENGFSLGGPSSCHRPTLHSRNTFLW